ncbi:MAG: 50S ribosomal protein L29 [Clostridia bacterium]|nr:50S ribosomal protein L29 [Clostridia bacterium]
MKSSKYFEMTTVELERQYNTLKEELFNLRFKNKAGQLDNAMQLAECKKNIARVLTILRQRELGISAEPTAQAKKKAKKA